MMHIIVVGTQHDFLLLSGALAQAIRTPFTLAHAADWETPHADAVVFSAERLADADSATFRQGVPRVALIDAAREAEAVQMVSNGTIADYLVREALDPRLAERVLLLVIERARAEQGKKERVRLSRALRDLKFRASIEGLLSNLSTAFINLPADQIDSGIVYAMHLLGEFLGRVDRIYIGAFLDDPRFSKATHEWYAPGFPPLGGVDAVPAYTMPWWHSRMLRGEVVYLPNSAALPPEAETERAFMAQHGLRSTLDIPMIREATHKGYIAFQSFRKTRQWSEADISLLRVVGEIFLNALERKRTEQALHEREEVIRQYALELEQRVQQRTNALAQQRQQLNTILDGLTEGVAYARLARPLDIPYCNRAFYDLLGVSPDTLLTEQILVQRLGGVAEFEKYFASALAALSQTGKWNGEMTCYHPDGLRMLVHVQLSVIHHTDAAQPLEFVALVRDISQEKRLEQQKDRFIANASHELRTPLANLKMRLYLLDKQPHMLDEHKRVMDRVANRMQELIEDLLDVTRFEQGGVPLHREAVILQTLVQDVITVQQPEADHKHIRLWADMPAEPLLNVIDAGRMIQVLTNLVVNALNFTPEGGEVCVRLAQTACDGTTSPCHLIQVRDTGVGISPNALPHVFSPFFRTNVGVVRGTGLGLTISREIVELHGGSIDVQSTPGQGTTLTILLPIHHDFQADGSLPSLVVGAG